MCLICALHVRMHPGLEMTRTGSVAGKLAAKGATSSSNCTACAPGTFSGPGRVEQLGKAWLVVGCPTARQTRSLDPAMVDAHAAVGHVVCCSADFNATREGCTSAGTERSSVTFWVAKAQCEARGWRLCRKEELEHSIGGAEWGTCAFENRVCWCNGEVRYGDPASDRWSAVQTVSGSVECSNGIFGDPAHGITTKECQCKNPGASGSCGTECGYDTKYVWADLVDECTTRPAGKFSEAKATICQDCTAEEGYACHGGSSSPWGSLCRTEYYCPGGAMGMQTWSYARARGITGYTKTEM